MRKVLQNKLLIFILCLWAYTAQTQEILVKDINPGVGWSQIDFKFRIGEEFYFTANGDSGNELWISDGTDTGTKVLKDINPGAFEDANPDNFINYSGLWFFTADDGENGIELWTTDGTENGTQLFMDINDGAGGSNPEGLVIIDDILYFSANDGSNGQELWKSDGTTGGTIMVADILPGATGSQPEGMTALGSEIVFVANDGVNGQELWKSNGTAAGTTLIKDINSGSSSSFANTLTTVADKVYFIADDGVSGKEIWVTDGTTGGTNLTTDVVAGAGHPQANNLIAAGNFLFFVGNNGTNGIELFRSDASAMMPTVEMVEIFADTFGSTPTEFIILNDDLLFNANSGGNGYELWKANGSDGSVSMVKDIFPGFGSSFPAMLAVLNNEVIFRAKGEGIGFELWKTDGTEAGTVLLGDLNTDPSTDDSDSDPVRPLIKDGVLYFTATDYINGYQIWRTDGTSVSTQRLTDIPHDTIFNNTHKPYFINNIGNEVINFVGLSGPVGEELWAAQITPVTITNIETNSPLECNGDTDGTISLSVAGGVGDPACFNYTWSVPGLNGLNVSGLAAGSYTITVTDCVGFETISTIVIDEPEALDASTSQSGAILCNGGSEGAATVNGIGGTAPYTYLWENGQTSQTATGLAAGEEGVTITDVNGCIFETSVFLNEPTVLELSASADNEICFGADNGQATAMSSGATAPYTYLWDNNETTITAINLTAGIHTLTVTDANGCTATTSVNIASFEAIELAFDNTNISCINGSNGSSTADAIGGSGSGYSYSWSNGATGNTVNDLAAGEICVTVTDDQGCTAADCTNILSPIVSAAVANNVSCNGGTDGSATVSIENANSTYTYSWDNGETTATANMLGAGMHSVTVTDALACTSVQTLTLNEPQVFSFTDSLVQSPSCFGAENGFISYNFTGGTMPYSYTWSTGAINNNPTLGGLSGGQTYCVTVTDANNCATFNFCTSLSEPEEIAITLDESLNATCFNECNGSASITVSNPAPGIVYTFNWSTGESNTGTNSTAINLCNGANTVSISDGTCSVVKTYLINQPEQIIANVTTVDVSCFGGADGSVAVNAVGGLGPYGLEFSDGTENLAAGTYSVTVTDANECAIVQDFIIDQPDAIILDYNIHEPSCVGASDANITTIPSGGTAPYTFEYSEGPADLSAGTYSVTVTDNNACTVIDDFTIEDPEPIEIINMVTNISCFGEVDGSVLTEVNGGNEPYAFEYSDGTENLAEGIYSVTVTDDNGCSDTANFEIIEPDSLVSEVVVNDISCFGANDGSAVTFTQGGTMPYGYEYSGGTQQDLAAGNYAVTTTDDRGCIRVDSFEIIEPEQIEISIEVTDVSCFGENDGSASVSVTGGTAPYEFESLYLDLIAGTYGVLVTDANACQVETFFDVNQPAEIVLTTSSTDATGNMADGTASVEAQGGEMPFSYEWNTVPPQTTETATNLPAGDYTVTVTDATGCTMTAIVTVDMFVNVTELDEALYFELYPNPADQSTLIDVQFGASTDIRLEVYDVLGKLIVSKALGTLYNEQITLDTRVFSPGVYWVKLNAEQGHYLRKLSIIRE